MARHWVAHGVKITLLGVVAAAVFGSVVMLLWNWLVPPLIGWSRVGFWQALGLLLLCRILLGSFHAGPSGSRPWRRRMIERWERMTPEEREKVRAAMRAHCCPDPAGPEPAGPEPAA